MNIETKRLSTEAKIDKLQQELIQLQENCPHERLTGKYRGDTGNYDPSQDSYWVEFRCLDCNKRWQEDQDETGYLVSKNGFKFTKV